MKTALFCALLVSVVAVSAAIDCYSCTNCGDPFDPNASGVSTTCPTVHGVQNKYCLKGVANNVVVRSCGLNVCSEGCVGDACIYCCETDLCNGGTTVKTSFVAMGVAMLAVFIFSKE